MFRLINPVERQAFHNRREQGEAEIHEAATAAESALASLEGRPNE